MKSKGWLSDDNIIKNIDINVCENHRTTEPITVANFCEVCIYQTSEML